MICVFYAVQAMSDTLRTVTLYELHSKCLFLFFEELGIFGRVFGTKTVQHKTLSTFLVLVTL